MSTRTQTTSTATDAKPATSTRRLAWLSEYGWLIAGCLLVLALVPAEADKAESATMRVNRERIAAMSRSERQRVEFNFQEYRKLTSQQRRDVQSLHEDVAADAELAAALTDWHHWLANLNFEDRESILQTTEAAARLALVREVLNATSENESRVELPSRAGTSLPEQNTRPMYAAVEFSALIGVIARHLDMPDSPQENTLPGKLLHHTSVVAELLARTRRPNGQNDSPARPFDRMRMPIPDDLRRQLIEALPDAARRRTIAQQDAAEQQRFLLQIIVSGFQRELQIVMQKLKPDDDMLLAMYLDLPEAQRNELDELPEELFSRRLDELWLERQFPDLARHIREIRRILPARINQRPGLLQNGNRPFLPGRRNGPAAGDR